MRIRSLTNRAKRLASKRGGADALKEDAAELKEIAKGSGSITDKAKAAGRALKEPGAERRETAPGGSEQSPAETQPPQEHGRGGAPEN